MTDQLVVITRIHLNEDFRILAIWELNLQYGVCIERFPSDSGAWFGSLHTARLHSNCETMSQVLPTWSYDMANILQQTAVSLVLQELGSHFKQ